MRIKKGIAYSGSKEEGCGTIEEKILKSKEEKMEFIQIRARDILKKNGEISDNIEPNLNELLGSFDGEKTVHLPSPRWDYDTLELRNEHMLISTIRTILIPLGITKYTIHPHFNRETYESLPLEEKKRVLIKMAKYFADIVSSGAYLAIENIPVRNLEEIKEMPDSRKKQKSLKNISYGMTIDEIDKILAITRKYVEQRTGDEKLANKRVGITFDTGHSLARIDDEQAKKAELEKWFKHYKDDMMICHITPSKKKNSDGSDSIKEEASKQTIEWVYELAEKYNVDALFLIEAHLSLQSMSKLYRMSCDISRKPSQVEL